MKRGRWVWLAALFLGVAAGLTYAWVLAPPRTASTTPDTLRLDFKAQFRSAIAAAYAATGDLERARARLALLGDDDPIQALSAQAQQALASGEPFAHAQELARLASDLQAGVSSIPARTATATASLIPSSTTVPTATIDMTSTAAVLTASPAAPTPSPTVSSTPVRPSTRTPIPTASAPFRLESKKETCDRSPYEALLQITVLDRGGRALPGVEITVTWDQGEERFFTGLQPEISDGYADFIMQAGTRYSVQVARRGAPVSGLAAPSCTSSGGQTYLGGLQLTFKEP